MRYIIAVAFILTICRNVSGQNFFALDSVKAPLQFDNIYVQKLASDSLSSSFLIFVKKEVKSHKHESHSEQVHFLAGSGILKVGDIESSVNPGDLIFIPKNTYHSLKVTSAETVKVLSIQSPFFDGSDRVMEK